MYSPHCANINELFYRCEGLLLLGFRTRELPMKNVAPFLLLLVCCTDLTWAQAIPFFVPTPATKLEIFAARKNVVITTESYYLTGTSGDSGCSVRFQSLILYEAGFESQIVRGLK